MKYLTLAARASLVLAIGGALLFSGCQQDEGFKCGQTIPGTSTIRTCDRGLEICVCGNNSCAKKVGLTEDERKTLAAGTSVLAGAAGDLESGPCSGPGQTGYMYSEAPYADSTHAGNCVQPFELLLGGYVPSKAAPGPGCPGQNPEAGVGGTTGGTGGSSNGGMSGGGVSGEGGMGGGGMSGEGGMSGGGMSSGGMSGDSSEGGDGPGGSSGAAASGAGGVP